jgi:TPP-dependent pyruvate/acetoin dehydrogenase alpha subunit
VEEEVAKAVEFAETSPEPALEELYADIYAD